MWRQVAYYRVFWRDHSGKRPNRSKQIGAKLSRDAGTQCPRRGPFIRTGVNEMDTRERIEAAAIARLLGADRTRKIGTIYLWNTAELTFLWEGTREEAKYIDPPISNEVLAHVKSATPAEVIEFLVSLPGVAADNPK